MSPFQSLYLSQTSFPFKIKAHWQHFCGRNSLICSHSTFYCEIFACPCWWRCSDSTAPQMSGAFNPGGAVVTGSSAAATLCEHRTQASHSKIADTHCLHRECDPRVWLKNKQRSWQCEDVANMCLLVLWESQLYDSRRAMGRYWKENDDSRVSLSRWRSVSVLFPGATLKPDLTLTLVSCRRVLSLSLCSWFSHLLETLPSHWFDTDVPNMSRTAGQKINDLY